MRPPSDTSRARRRQFTRIRHLTQAIFLGSGVASGFLVGYVANVANAAKVTTTTTPSGKTTTHCA